MSKFFRHNFFLIYAFLSLRNVASHTIGAPTTATLAFEPRSTPTSHQYHKPYVNPAKKV